MTNALQQFDFYGDTISTCKEERTGKVYCLPREISERLGVSWPAQWRKLQSSFFQKHTTRCFMATSQGEVETLLLDVDMLPSWLMGISAEKVKPERKDKLLLYQEECALALRNYWTQGVALNPRFEQHAMVQAISPASPKSCTRRFINNISGVVISPHLVVSTTSNSL